MPRGIYVRTPEMRKKASRITKKHLKLHPRPSGMLGKQHSEEAKAKISEASKGRKHSPASIQKMKDNHTGMTGKTHSDATKQKMSKSRKGRKLGPFSEEHKRKIGLASKGRRHTDETKAKMSVANKGRKWSKQQKENFIAARTGENHPRWEGGTCKSHGYNYVTTEKGKIFEHRVVMENSLGRELTSEEVVHHINGIKDDNRIENLQLFPNNKLHMEYHYENRIILLVPPL